MSAPQPNDRTPVAISLPARYWITVLALVDLGIQSTILPEWEALKKRGAHANDLSDEQRIALSGPIFARAAIVTALHQAGVMTPEANLQHGSDALRAMLRRFENDQNNRPE